MIDEMLGNKQSQICNPNSAMSLLIVREEFAKGNDFCQKITYKTTGRKPEDLIAEFRTSPMPRIAVTVDMIATGTDIKPLEVVLFMRSVKSRSFFEQMKGRGVRKGSWRKSFKSSLGCDTLKLTHATGM